MNFLSRVQLHRALSTMALALAVGSPLAVLAADRNAATDDGEKVVLHDDGRWETEDAAAFRAAAAIFIKAFVGQDVEGLKPFLPPSVSVTVHRTNNEGTAQVVAPSTTSEMTAHWAKQTTCGDEDMTGTVPNVSGMWCSLLFSYCGYDKCAPALTVDPLGHRVRTAGYTPTKASKGIAFTFEQLNTVWQLKSVELTAYYE